MTIMVGDDLILILGSSLGDSEINRSNQNPIANSN